MRTLVLGGSAFVGRALVDRCVADGHEVTVLNRGQSTTALPEGVSQLVADRKNWDQMQGVLRGTTWDAVVDVSAFVQVAGQSDMARLIELLDGNSGRYVFVSSIMAYEPTGLFPWHEDGPVRPDPPTTYGGFKVLVERLVLDQHAATGFPGCAVRPAAIYGPHNNIYDMEAAMFLRLLQGRPILVPHGGLVLNSYGHPVRSSTSRRQPRRRAPTSKRWARSPRRNPTWCWCPTRSRPHSRSPRGATSSTRSTTP
jgi:nucleoside-diphosphate-sugar epimerase